MGDVGERPGVDKGRLPFQCLHQVRMQRVFHQHRHRAGHLQVFERDRLLARAVADDDAADTLAQILERRA